MYNTYSKAKIIKHENAKEKRTETAFANEYFIASKREGEKISHFLSNYYYAN